MIRASVLSVAVMLVATSAKGADYVWWEGESPAATNFPKRSDFSPETFADRRDQLSGGDWLSNSGKRGKDEAFARYDIAVPAEGTYHLWTRKFWKHGPFRWRFDQQEWVECGKDVALADDTFLRQFIGANWVYLGDVKLPAGKHTFELRLLAKEGEATTACFDCFLLTPRPFVPNGKLKPDERSGKADEGFFAFEPAVDSFGESPIDLRYLNEKIAGQSGPLKRDKGRILLGDGTPVRFWAVNVSSNNAGQDHASIDYMARRLAKLGVNMVRYHSGIYDINDPKATVNAKALDNVQYLVAALKKEGIYTELSFYYPLWFDIKDPALGAFDKIKNTKPFALLYFVPELQARYRAGLKQALEAKNPYTGVSLAREPAVGVVELVNEDSFFFWTFSKANVPPDQWQKLETMFGSWAAKRYGSIDKALAAWGAAKLPQDDPAAGRAGIYEAWHMTADGAKQGGAAKAKRIGDQVNFLASTQRDFYASTVKFLRDDLKFGGLVSCSNWITADANTLDAIERYTYTAGDVLDQHGYFEGEHKGEGSAWSVRVGHTFKSLAAPTVPEKLPLRVAQVYGYPHIISEINWDNPNRFRADATFLSSAYGSLQGVSGIYFFALGSNYVRDTTLGKFAVASPVIAGTFPAAALAYRRGDIQTTRPGVFQLLSMAELYDMSGAGALPDALAYYVAPVVRGIDAPMDKAPQLMLKDYIDRDAKTIRSAANFELKWDWGKGVVTIDTPRTQGAAGFLAKAGRIELKHATIDCQNEYAAIMITELGDKPAGGWLIQVMTEERPYGFKTDGEKITDMGSAPFGVKKIAGSVSIHVAGNPTVTALDENGYPTKKAIKSSVKDGVMTIELGEDVVYYVVKP